MGNTDEAAAHLEQARTPNDAEKVDDYAPEEIQTEVRNLNDPAWTQAQRRYLRKLNSIILPAISVLYFFEYLDRGNVAAGPVSGYAVLREVLSDILICYRMPSCTDSTQAIVPQAGALVPEPGVSPRHNGSL